MSHREVVKLVSLALYSVLLYLVLLWPNWPAYLRLLIISGAFLLLGIVVPDCLLLRRDQVLARTRHRRNLNRIIRLTFSWYKVLKGLTYCILLIILPCIVLIIRFDLLWSRVWLLVMPAAQWHATRSF